MARQNQPGGPPPNLTHFLNRLREEFAIQANRAKLFDLALAIGSKIDNIDETLSLILNAAIDREKIAESGSLFLFDQESTTLKLIRKTGTQRFVQYTEFGLGEGVAGYAGSTRQTVLINDCATDFRYKAYTADAPQIRSIIAVPILAPGSTQLLGVLCIHNSEANRQFTLGDQQFVEGLARIAGMAWNNSLTHQRVVSSTHMDPMTGLLNRQGIESVLQEYFGKAKISGQPLSVLYSDLDNLKQLNDGFSTDIGDRALITVASVIKEQTYSTWRDKAGKWKDGDEFVVILPGTPMDRAKEVAESIRKVVETRVLEGVNADLPHVTVSIGIAQLSEGDRSGHDLALRVERAKQKAKEQGKNQVAIDP